MGPRSRAARLRVYVGESDRYQGKPLFEAIVLRARELGLSGATVFRGIMGFGGHSRIHTARVLRLSEDLPVVVELVDRREKVEAFLEELDAMVSEGLVTLEELEVVWYRGND